MSLIGLKTTATVDHGHLSTQWAIVAPMAIGAICGFIVWQLKGLGFRASISTRYLSALVVGFFLIQELIEGLGGGQSILQILRHPAIIAGVFIGPIVAWLLCRFLRGVTELAAKLLARPPLHIPPPQVRLIPIPVRDTSRGSGSRSRQRAPPSNLRS